MNYFPFGATLELMALPISEQQNGCTEPLGSYVFVCKTPKHHRTFLADICIQPNVFLVRIGHQRRIVRHTDSHMNSWYKPDDHRIRYRSGIHRERNGLKDFQCTRASTCIRDVPCECCRILDCTAHSFRMDLASIGPLLWADSINMRAYTYTAISKDNEPLVNGRQLINGSPVISRGQLHTGVNPLRLQSAPVPQAPSQVFLQIP